MKKSEVIYDLEQIYSRLESLKTSTCLNNSQTEIERIKQSISDIKSKISFGVTYSITGRDNPTLPKSTCRFCGK
ncbi:hypothetical protein BDD26_2056 [Xenorhabdus cabanillasii]|uniref:Uncharacterized protein n=1 Tax=Xenorhabdus cabanillasii TaxID=351673 RepID=A0A3D9UMT5_9GAMM|nr:hypothetical protein BDD26_2056 [Xenorhabdus cabanillasii]